MNMVLALEIDKSTFPAAKFGTIGALFNLVVSSLIIIAGLIFIVMLLTGAFTIITAGGDAEKVKKAQKTFQYAILGLVVVLASFAIVQLIRVVLNIPKSQFPL